MSSDLAVSARGVGKDYLLGRSGRTTSLAEILASRLRHPLAPGRSRRELFTALNGVSFDIERGEVVGIIGKNGSGKSTLLKILSRITHPTRGRIDLRGRVGCLLEVGTGFHPELTGRENIYLNGAILGMKRRTIDERYDEITAFADIPDFLDTPVKRYSSGMRVRLAFAVAAHLDPEILVVDEVLSVGDANFQAKCLEKMRSVASDQGRTVLYVSHNLVTVEHLCPRTMLLVGGRLEYDGDTDEAISRHLSLARHGGQAHEAGVFDLATADRSSGGYQKVFKSLALRPGNGTPTDALRMGDPLLIEIAVEGLATVPKAMIQVVFGSSLSQCVFRMTSHMTTLVSEHPRQHHETIVIDIPSLPLTPGDYHINVKVLGGTRAVVDQVNRAAGFTVIPADVLGSGYQFSARDGQFMVPWEWQIRPSSDA